MKNKTLLVASIALFILMIGLSALQKFCASSLYVVDMKRLIEEPATLLSKSKLSPQRQAETLKAYAETLPQVMESYSQKKKGVIIAAPIVASHASMDITNLIMRQTLQGVYHE